ncbi:UNVERIFIED_CONTAM: hypothetical protein OHV15_19670, partial [Microbacterium sp. SLM126]
SVARDGELVPQDQEVLRAGDIVSVMAHTPALPRLSRMFLTETTPPAWDQVAHDFLLDAEARLADVAALYGAGPLPAGQQDSTLAEAMLAAFPSPPVEGDTVEIAGLRLSVTRMEGPRIVQVGLLLPRNAAEEARDDKARLWRLRDRARPLSPPSRRKP